MEKWLHSLPEPYFSCVTLSFLAANSKMELGLCCLGHLPRKGGGKERSHLHGPFHPPPAVRYHCLVQGLQHV